MAYKDVGPQLDDILKRISTRAGRTRFSPKQQRVFGAVTNIGGIAKFLDRLVQEHAKLVEGSAFRDPKLNFDMKLVNVASSKTKSGTPFFYFDAIDRGRKAVRAKEGSVLVFSAHAGDRAFRGEVKAAPPQDITGQALSDIHATFPAEAVEVFRQFLNQKSFQPQVRTSKGPRFAKGFKRVPLGQVAVKGTLFVDTNSPRRKLQFEQPVKQKVRAITDDVKLLPEYKLPELLGNEQQAQFVLEAGARQMREIQQQLRIGGKEAEEKLEKVYGSAFAALREANKRAIEQAERRVKEVQGNRRSILRDNASRSGKLLGNIFASGARVNQPTKIFTDRVLGPPQLDQASKQVRNLLRTMSYKQLVAMFEPVITKQAAVFQKYTPSRADEGRYRLAVTGTVDAKGRTRNEKGKFAKPSDLYTIEPPETGGTLRASYVFLTDDKFIKFAKSQST